ncbi:MAG: right-handed parallel beta-helix repeat-containing protein [Saprospiraceae bacterium]|nr:right-handed parallel beta-helix repeat-containing protein [Saprospiraceae bacterium]MBK9728229.1 right-handed parallel beta-helix repeat-containing protein [Saprospiraceae bacterium]
MQKFNLVNIVFFIFHITGFGNEYNIKSFGAIGDGVTINTIAIQKAIDKAHADGGGMVVIPAGKFVSGSIILKNRVGLHLDKRAILLGSVDFKDYIRLYKWMALILAENASNISISGKGTIDGRGAELGLHVDSLFYAGQIDSHNYHIAEKRPWHELRPHIIEFTGCRNIKITNVRIKNAASWVQSYEKCKNIIIHKIHVDSDAYWNNDGIDIVDCQNVQITNCFINASDDGICIKSEDFSLSQICDSIYIADCTIRSSASAVKFGTSLVSGARNVVIRNIKIYDTFRSAIAIEATQGGFIENVLVENIVAKNTGNAIFMRIGRVRGAEKAGPLRNVTIRNMKVIVPFEKPDINYKIRGPELPFFHNIFPSSITGNPGVYVENVIIENIKIRYPGKGNKAFSNLPLYRIKDVPELETSYPEFSMFGELPAWGFYVRHVKGILFKNIDLKIKEPDYRPAMVFDDTHNLRLESVKVRGDNKLSPIFYKDTTHVEFDNLKVYIKK